jgi:hypothetical protein
MFEMELRKDARSSSTIQFTHPKLQIQLSNVQESDEKSCSNILGWDPICLNMVPCVKHCSEIQNFQQWHNFQAFSLDWETALYFLKLILELLCLSIYRDWLLVPGFSQSPDVTFSSVELDNTPSYPRLDSVEKCRKALYSDEIFPELTTQNKKLCRSFH